jgi:hypothetical protein
MPLILSLFLSLGLAQYISDLEIEQLSFDAHTFTEVFNRAVDDARLITILSPT